MAKDEKDGFLFSHSVMCIRV